MFDVKCKCTTFCFKHYVVFMIFFSQFVHSITIKKLKLLRVCSKSRYFVAKIIRTMINDKVYIHEIEGGDVDFLHAEQEPIKMTLTGIFLCKAGEVKLLIDNVEYHLTKNSLIVYFSYSTLRILRHTSNLSGTLIGSNLETIQPMLYQVSNFNALFVIKEKPLQQISDSQFELLQQHIELITVMLERDKKEMEYKCADNNSPISEMTKKQTEVLSYSLILEVLRCYTNTTCAISSLTRRDEILQKFVTSLYKKFRTEHEVNYYASQQFLSSRYFSTIIKEQSGKSPSEWIATALMVDAQNLLRTTNMSIKEISDLMNFPNQSYFGKWFKKLTGLRPLEFRKGKPARVIEDSNFADVIQRGLNHINSGPSTSIILH